jgi:hypoxanthine phosphoribosyltransferase
MYCPIDRFLNGDDSVKKTFSGGLACYVNSSRHRWPETFNLASRIKTLYSAEQIQRRIAEMGEEISADYKSLPAPVVIGVMKGAFCFLADLVRNIHLEETLQVEFVRLASYGSASESGGTVQTPYLELPNISCRHILVIEDIVDSGRTARSFLDKPSRRVVTVKPDYVGFTINDLFVVGYGLDYAEKYRELPYLGELDGVEAK